MTDRNWRDGLSKWRAEAIDKLLTKGALSWPTEAEPAPMPFRWGDYDRLIGTPKAGTYWTAIVALYGGSRAEKVELRMSMPGERRDYGDVGDHWRFNDSSHVIRGPLYRTERDALLAARWRLCRQFAETLAKLDADLDGATND